MWNYWPILTIFKILRPYDVCTKIHQKLLAVFYALGYIDRYQPTGRINIDKSSESVIQTHNTLTTIVTNFATKKTKWATVQNYQICFDSQSSIRAIYKHGFYVVNSNYAYVWLNGLVKKQNYRKWNDTNSQETPQTPFKMFFVKISRSAHMTEIIFKYYWMYWSFEKKFFIKTKIFVVFFTITTMPVLKRSPYMKNTSVALVL